MTNNKDSQFFVRSNEDVAGELLLYLHGDKIEYYEKQDTVTNIIFVSIIPSVKNNFFHRRMVGFVNKPDLSDKNIKLMVL